MILKEWRFDKWYITQVIEIGRVVKRYDDINTSIENYNNDSKELKRDIKSLANIVTESNYLTSEIEIKFDLFKVLCDKI